MSVGHSLALLAIVVFILWLFLRPDRQALVVEATPAQAEVCITAPPPQCKPQGDVDCRRARTKEIA